MARGSSQATGAATSAQNLSNKLQGNSSELYSTLAPQLMAEAAHPPGMTEADLAAENTAAQQSAGGSMAGAVGQGALLKARTRNAGAGDAAIEAASRGAGEQLSKNAIGIRTANAMLKEKQRQEGLSGLEGLNAEQTGAGIGALGQVAPNVNANTNAANESWDWAKYILDPAMAGAGQGAGLAAGCWIAEAVYGADDLRTHLVRAWLNGPFAETRIGNLVMRLYLKIGRRVAAVTERSSMLRTLLMPVFDLALEKAM